MVIVFLSLAFPLAGQEAGPGAPGRAGSRLVIVTFERRVGPAFQRAPERYGPFLQEQRENVVGLLFAGDSALVGPSDFVAFFADGVTTEALASIALPSDAAVDRVMQALEPLLELPGGEWTESGPPRLWLTAIGGEASRGEVDRAIRRLVTCPLAGGAGECDESAAQGAVRDVTRAYSRPLLTFPVQYALATNELRERHGRLPDEVFWVWVQVGEPVNETNSLASEIFRDFRASPETAEAISRFRDWSLATLRLQLLPGPPAPARREEGGATLWKVTSPRIDDLLTPNATFPLTIEGEGSGRWRPLDRERHDSIPWFSAGRPLLERSRLRLALGPAAVREGAVFLRADAEAVCSASGGRSVEAPLRLEFSVDPRVPHATLAPASSRALAALAARCRPSTGALAGLVRVLTTRKDERTLIVTAHAQIAPPRDEASDLAAPAILAQAALVRSWRQQLLGFSDWVVHILIASLLGYGLFTLVRLARLQFRPVQLDLVLMWGSKPVNAETLVPLSPGPSGTTQRLELRAIHAGGPRRRVRFEVRVRGAAFQSQVPVVPGTPVERLIWLRAHDRGDAPTHFELDEVPAASTDGGTPMPLTLHVSEDVIDLDRAPARVPLRAGIEITARVPSVHARLRGVKRVFYVPCAIEVQRVSAPEPGLRIEPFQLYVYRGLRPPGSSDPGQATALGMLRVTHRAPPGAVARPHAVQLRLWLQAAAFDEGRTMVAPTPLSFRRDDPMADTLELEVDDAETLVPLFVWRKEICLPDHVSGEVVVRVGGEWVETRSGAVAAQLAETSATVPWYPVTELYGVAVDFGTSGTRIALLKEDTSPERAMGVALPQQLIHPPGSDPGELGGELGSELAIAPDGALLGAGAGSHLRGGGYLPSLKEALMARRQGAWEVAPQLVTLLGAPVEQARRDHSRLKLCRWIDGAWRFDQLALSPGFRYLLLVTVPDTFSQRDQDEFVRCFEEWRGRVRIFPLREAEAVVYGSLMREPERHPRRTLVVDVGAGSVDYAAVRAKFDESTLVELRIEGLAVSRTAGNQYDRDLAKHLKITHLAERTQRETKEQDYTDPEVSGTPETKEMRLFKESPEFARHMREAVEFPLAVLRGRLCLHDNWREARFDRVVLSGRGSLALGWKESLVKTLRDAELVPERAEAEWLQWLPAGSPLDRADRLKAAVSEGALALVSHTQVRVQTSREILRNHLVLVGQPEAGRYDARLVAKAGEYVPVDGITYPVPVPNWIEARLVHSSHPPPVPGATESVSAHLLWLRSPPPEQPEDAADDLAGTHPDPIAAGVADGSPPLVEASFEIPLRTRPGVDSRGFVTIRQGGITEFAWQQRGSPSLSQT